MVKSLMDLFDVVFPFTIGPLTYGGPSGYDGPIVSGMAVTAEIKKSMKHGIIMRRATHLPAGPVKEISGIVTDKPVVSLSLLSLLKWMSGYYLVPEGVVLKSMPLIEYFEKPKREKKQKVKTDDSAPLNNIGLPVISSDITSPVRESLLRKEYKTFLLHSPSLSHEISYLLDIVKGIGNVIILVPEITHIELLSPLLKRVCGDRLTVLHGQLTKARRRKAIGRILSGDTDIILGTRIAASAPLPSVSLISVLQEQNRSYKNLEGIRYHARDVAVMRGYLEKSTVVLSSTSPSLESFYNTLKGKYTLMRPAGQFQRPKVEVINMNTSRKITPHLSRRAVDSASACIKNREGILFFINRKGYSLIQCAECNNIETCPECGIPLIFHKNRALLKCHYCNYTSSVPDTCRRCRSTRLETVGAGTERIAADIKKHLAIEPLRFDKDAIRENPEMKGLAGVLRGEDVVVATRAVTGKLRHGDAYKLCVFLNPDISLHMPDFRSSELIFQEIIGISEYIKPQGLILIQTKMPENYLFRCIRNYNFDNFFREELAMRKSLSYPPFSRIIVITISSTDGEKKRTVLHALTQPDERIEVIGPIELSKKGTHIWKVLMKSPLKEKLLLYANNYLKKIGKEKGLRIAVDVDPISL